MIKPYDHTQKSSRFRKAFSGFQEDINDSKKNKNQKPIKTRKNNKECNIPHLGVSFDFDMTIRN